MRLSVRAIHSKLHRTRTRLRLDVMVPVESIIDDSGRGMIINQLSN